MNGSLCPSTDDGRLCLRLFSEPGKHAFTATHVSDLQRAGDQRTHIACGTFRAGTHGPARQPTLRIGNSAPRGPRTPSSSSHTWLERSALRAPATTFHPRILRWMRLPFVPWPEAGELDPLAASTPGSTYLAANIPPAGSVASCASVIAAPPPSCWKTPCPPSAGPPNSVAIWWRWICASPPIGVPGHPA